MTAPLLQPVSTPVTQLAGTQMIQVDTAFDPNASVQASPAWATVWDILTLEPGVPTYSKNDRTTYNNVDPVTGIVTTAQGKVSVSTTVTGTRLRNVYPDAGDNAGWKKLKDASDNNYSVHVRYFDTAGVNPAKEGYADSTYAQKGGSPTADGNDDFTLEFLRPVTTIANPFAGSLVPNAASVTPTMGAAGTTVTITGVNMDRISGADGVKFGSVNAVYSVVNSTTATASVPAGAPTGSVPITVKGAAGSDPSTVAFTKS